MPDLHCGITRRRFLMGCAAAVGAAGFGQMQPLLRGAAVTLGEPAELSLPPAEQPDAVPALARRFPWLWHGVRTQAALQLANPLHTALEYDASGGASLGECAFRAPDGSAVVPWAPLFRRRPALAPAPARLRELSASRQLAIQDEGSDTQLLYGNKLRKYEFVLPNLAAAGVETVHTHGAYGSNHCAHLALALRYGRFAPAGTTMRLAAGLYPQPLTHDVATKLRLLLACGARLEFLESDLHTALSIIERRRVNAATDTPREGYVPSGGSSPLAVLGHLNALVELDEHIRAGEAALQAPPDYLFVALGSGATAIGLVLGCHLLGWPTRVVTAPSQDKSLAAKLIVNRDPTSTFVLPHAREQLAAALDWARRLGLPVDANGEVTADDLLARHFEIDRGAWLPRYGEMSDDVRALRDVAQAEGLTLDGTFTAKAFGALRNAGSQGRLRDAAVLFWNTYQRYDLARLLPSDAGWLSHLPAPLAGELGAFVT